MRDRLEAMPVGTEVKSDNRQLRRSKVSRSL